MNMVYVALQFTGARGLDRNPGKKFDRMDVLVHVSKNEPKKEPSAQRKHVKKWNRVYRLIGDIDGEALLEHAGSLRQPGRIGFALRYGRREEGVRGLLADTTYNFPTGVGSRFSRLDAEIYRICLDELAGMGVKLLIPTLEPGETTNYPILKIGKGNGSAAFRARNVNYISLQPE